MKNIIRFFAGLLSLIWVVILLVYFFGFYLIYKAITNKELRPFWYSLIIVPINLALAYLTYLGAMKLLF